MNDQSFASLGLSDDLLRALESIGYRTPTPIQAQAVPHLLAGRDLLGIAQTGTGKTAAFGLPLLQRLCHGNARGGAELAAGGSGSPRVADPGHSRSGANIVRVRGATLAGDRSHNGQHRTHNAHHPSQRVAGCPRALILAPTRELALQIADELNGFGCHLPLVHAVIFGGVGQRPQVDRLRRGVDVLVATPGRLLDLIGQGHADLSRVEVLVLDEADRLLDMGFIRDVQRIVRQTPKTRQSLLFSATMPKEVAALAAELLDRPVRVDVSPKAVTVERIRQRLIRADNSEKRWVLEHLLGEDGVSRAIVFTRTKHGANKVAKHLLESGINAEAIHGNKSQSARQRALQNFKDGISRVLVATDIAARGIDVQGVSHVINYELPDEPESYVHRIGRTGRAGAGGVAWSLVDPAEGNRLRGIERLVGRIPDEATAALTEAPQGALRRQPEGRAGARVESAGIAAGTRHDPGPADVGPAPARRRAGGGRRGRGSRDQQARGNNPGQRRRGRRSEQRRSAERRPVGRTVG